MMTSRDPPSVTYQDATLEDATALQDLIQSAFRASDTRTSWTGDATKFLNDTFTISIDAIKNAIENENSLFVLVYEEMTSKTSPIACFNITKKSDHVASIAWFTVASKYQQFGVGRHLLAHAETDSRQRWPDLRTMELNALSSRDALIAWYERNGYVRTGKFVEFPTEGMDDDMKEKLKGIGFVFLEKNL